MSNEHRALITPQVFPDLPLQAGRLDDEASFRFDDYANTFARLIAAHDTRTPLVISVNGEWGSGKTTLLNLNSSEGGVGDTSPVGQYSPDGDSPYGVADIVGNVWEWTNTLFKPYPYERDDGREADSGRGARVARRFLQRPS